MTEAERLNERGRELGERRGHPGGDRQRALVSEVALETPSRGSNGRSSLSGVAARDERDVDELLERWLERAAYDRHAGYTLVAGGP